MRKQVMTTTQKRAIYEAVNRLVTSCSQTGENHKAGMLASIVEGMLEGGMTISEGFGSWGWNGPEHKKEIQETIDAIVANIEFAPFGLKQALYRLLTELHFILGETIIFVDPN